MYSKYYYSNNLVYISNNHFHCIFHNYLYHNNIHHCFYNNHFCINYIHLNLLNQYSIMHNLNHNMDMFHLLMSNYLYILYIYHILLFHIHHTNIQNIYLYQRLFFSLKLLLIKKNKKNGRFNPK